jgi:endonuclease YncB( thermonuclease family)
MITNVSQSIYVYKATCLRVIDGDTIDAQIDLGFKINWSSHIRFQGIDVYETRGATKNDLGVAGKQFTQLAFDTFGTDFYLKSIKDEVAIYNRVAGELYLETKTADGHRAFVDLIQSLRANGYDKSGAVPHNTGDPIWIIRQADDIMSLFV